MKIVPQCSHISSFFFSWWNLKPTRHRFLNLNYASQRLMERRRVESAKPRQAKYAWVPESQGREGGGGEGDPSISGVLACYPADSWTPNYVDKETPTVTALCLSSSFCLSASLSAFPVCLTATYQIIVSELPLFSCFCGSLGIFLIWDNTRYH